MPYNKIKIPSLWYKRNNNKGESMRKYPNRIYGIYKKANENIHTKIDGSD